LQRAAEEYEVDLTSILLMVGPSYCVFGADKYLDALSTLVALPGPGDRPLRLYFSPIALAMPKRMDPRALRALIKADEFEMVRSSPWPSSISEMIAKGWSYPNGENFTPEAWARLAQHDNGTRSLFVVCGPLGSSPVAKR
jgi:hypothetical protein